MRTLIVYDSVYGNTEKIAKAIGSAIAGETKVLHAGETDLSRLVEFDLIIIGSPTHGGRPTKAIKDFLDQIPANAIKGTAVASFDTRVESKGIFLGTITKIFGYAAPRIAKDLEQKGAKARAAPEGFIVKDSEGPLKEGELERAAGWGKQISRESP